MDTEAEEDTTHHFPTALSPEPRRRSICSNCRRPNPVCLCHALPVHPIQTTTRVFILHHPHEAQHKLSTTPILTKTLLNATAVTGRRIRPGLSPLLDQFPPALYLFPATHSSPAVNISDLRPSELLTRSGDNGGGLVLIAFDATWKHAREMVKASEQFLSKFAIRVCLGTEDENVSGGSIYDSELILRKEPFSGCVSTMEAVARALRVLEPNGLEIEGMLIGILREMVRLQAGFLKPIKPRPKLLKKKLKEVEKSEGSEQEAQGIREDKRTTISGSLSKCQTGVEGKHIRESKWLEHHTSQININLVLFQDGMKNYKSTKKFALGSPADDLELLVPRTLPYLALAAKLWKLYILPEPPIPKLLCSEVLMFLDSRVTMGFINGSRASSIKHPIA
ncbi:hypothetical protein SESBI_08036 [Sesbania bispinosa]|nr:hypothetical protein SESBI_08036 [Sesbania bispinosa]